MVFPFAVLCKLEGWLSYRKSEVLFSTFGQIMAILPGQPGAFLRRAFYTLTLDKCSNHCHIGFGSMFSHTKAVVEDHVYIGNYALIGSAYLGKRCLIGSRASILSGKDLHVLDEEGNWTDYSPDRLQKVNIAKNVWVGEGAIISANVGEGSMIGAGSVVTSNVKPRVLMSGNPARFIKKLDVAEASSPVNES